jgi:diaminohydroxyphosphoribosylaminopyrimidine deaminase/5-amino-6-(5-phosphoribosylamino)uracil reductase
MNDSSRSSNSAKHYLDLAARSALRGFGLVEPNPMVGAVIVKDDQLIGLGHHTRFGALHAEREALKNCNDRGFDPKGATLYCTLEPCSHHGKQPPCTDAVIKSGISRVVIARKDPAEASAGGVEILRDAGIEVVLTDISSNASHLSDPFVHRVQTGRPWVIAKWAQTIDGRIATSAGESQWISNPRCRSRVHRLRAKVDAIMIGIGTATTDDPMLNARDCRSVRKVAKRVVLDTNARVDPNSKLIRSASIIPTIICTSNPDKLSDLPCTIIECPSSDSGIDLNAALQKLAAEYDITTLLIEAGPRVLGAFIQHDLINEAVVHLAPGIMGDEHAKAVATGRDAPELSEMRRFELVRTKQIHNDIELHYRKF